jgi:hypothetical protein
LDFWERLNGSSANNLLSLDAIQLSDRFEGRWLRGGEFHYPERPKDLPLMKPLKNWPKFDPRKARG